MIIVSVSENRNVEKRISITPDISKKYINLGFEVHLSENYGEHLGFKDDEFKAHGVKIVSDEKKILIVEKLWQIIYSNNDVDIYESNLMRRLGGLLYIDSKIMGNIKEKIKKQNSK